MEMKVIGNRDVEGGEGLGVNDFEELLVSMFWYYKSLWVIFNMVVNFFILIIFLYWILVFGGKISGLDVIIYLLNCIFMLVDLMFSLIFVWIFYVVYFLIFGVFYLLLIVIFWVVDGINVCGEFYIYLFVDYNEILGFLSGFVFGFVFVG